MDTKSLESQVKASVNGLSNNNFPYSQEVNERQLEASVLNLTPQEFHQYKTDLNRPSSHVVDYKAEKDQQKATDHAYRYIMSFGNDLDKNVATKLRDEVLTASKTIDVDPTLIDSTIGEAVSAIDAIVGEGLNVASVSQNLSSFWKAPEAAPVQAALDSLASSFESYGNGQDNIATTASAISDIYQKKQMIDKLAIQSQREQRVRNSGEGNTIPKTNSFLTK